MNPILQALTAGYSANKILQYVSKSNPALTKKIESALAIGYTAEKVLKYVMQGGNELSNDLPRNNPQNSTIYDQLQYSMPKEVGNIARTGVALGTAYGLGSLFFNQNQTGTSQGAQQPQPGGQGPTGPQPPSGPTPQAAPGPQPPIATGTQPTRRGQPQPPLPNAQANPPQNALPSQQGQPTTPLSQTIQRQLPQEENPIAKEKSKQAALGKFHNKLRATTLREQLLKDYEDTYGPPSEAIKQLPPEDLEAIVNVVKQPEQLAPGQPKPEQPQNAIGEEQNVQGETNTENQQPPFDHEQNNTEMVPEKQAEITQTTPKEKPKLAKGSQVITPSGDIAEIEDLPGKSAKVNVDGKKEVLDSEDLTPVPENEEEILSLYEKLIQKIPEHLRSSMLNWVGYDPERNILQVKFHNGASYTYENIPSEFADKLKDVDFLAKTTGGNYYGNWEAGENSRGAGVSALIKDLQKTYGGKGKEYSAKFNEVYSFLGLPEEKLREKHKREREEKKKRKGAS